MANSKSGLAALVLGSIGIVYGDIGTSVLYAFKELFSAGHLSLNEANILGLLSLLFWTLTIVVSLKYVLLVLRADNRGEGGMVAMLALAAQGVTHKPKVRAFLLALGIFGTALFYGDGVITPAISVLSAVEGLKLIVPQSQPFVLPIAIVVIFALFLIQKHGTQGVGRLFAPVMLLWFLLIGAIGVFQVVDHPDVLRALSPHYAIGFITENPGITFLILSALVLCVTGAEALYADMGHFGKRPIRIAWFAIVMPSLTLNYFGQGALLLHSPAAVENPFYLMAPSWLLAPLVLIATLAAIIASQALISGAFSITKQVIQMGYLPRLRILYTNADNAGQIYIPFVNWALFTAIILAIATFKTSGALAAAYGVAVCGLMFVTTVLTFFVIYYHWKLPLAVCIAATIFFLIVDAAFLSSALLKVVSGGWFPLVLAVALYLVMQTWRKGQTLLSARLQENALDIDPFIENVFLDPPHRVEGTAVFLTANDKKVPAAFLHNLKHNKVLHEQIVFVTIRYHEVPRVGFEKRYELKALGHHCWQVTLNYGFKNDLNIPRDLESIREWGFELDPMQTSYFLGRDQIISSFKKEAMVEWRRVMFAQMHRNASAMSDHLKLPSNAVVELGAKVEI